MWSTRTVAEFALRSIEFGARPAQRVKRDGAWHDVSYAEVGAAAVEVALGLVALGVAPGDRVCVLAETRPEWSPIQYGIASTASRRRAALRCRSTRRAPRTSASG